MSRLPIVQELGKLERYSTVMLGILQSRLEMSNNDVAAAAAAAAATATRLSTRFSLVEHKVFHITCRYHAWAQWHEQLAPFCHQLLYWLPGCLYLLRRRWLTQNFTVQFLANGPAFYLATCASSNLTVGFDIQVLYHLG